MPRKKTLDKPVSNLEVKAKKPTTTRKKVAIAVEPESLNSEVNDVLGDDVALVFRPRSAQSEAPDRSVRGRSTPATKPAASVKAKVVKASEPDATNWDEELPIPAFRTRSEAAVPTPRPRQNSLAPSLTPTSPPEPRSARARNQRREKPVQENDEFREERHDRRDDEGSNPAREFEPTAILEFDDEGETVMVKMRERGDEPTPKAPAVRSQGRTTLSNKTITEPVQKKEPEKVVIPPRALIDIPEDAPQIVMRNGVPTLVRETKVYPNFWFYAAPPDEERIMTVLQEIRQAAESGVHVFCIGQSATNTTLTHCLTSAKHCWQELLS
jgi:hypothetical protein